MRPEFEFKASARHCGDCQLCCKLLPMKQADNAMAAETFAGLVEAGIADPRTRLTPAMDKPAGERCPHQRHHKGCAIYAVRPFGCRFWSCQWLLEDDTAELSRPDRSHYVIDPSPDYVIADGEHKLEVVQVWIDPNYPDAHKDPALRAYLRRRGEEGRAALIRSNAHDGFVLFPPQMSDTGDFFEKRTNCGSEPEHSAEQVVEAVGLRQVRIRL